jgi:hypothetical protein
LTNPRRAEAWDEIVTEGDVMSKDRVLRFKRNGQVSAVASIFRDLESLEAEVLMERANGAQSSRTVDSM